MRTRPSSLLTVLALLLLARCDSVPITQVELDDTEPPTGSPDVPQPEPSPAPPSEPSPSVPRSITIDGPAVVGLSPGEERALELRLRDAGFQILDVPFDRTWSADPSARVSVDSAGVVRAGDELGLGWVFARSGEMRDSVAVWIQPPASQPSEFEITLVYADDVPDWARMALEQAAERWEEVVRARLPAVAVASMRSVCTFLTPPPETFFRGMEDGVRLWIQVSHGFPPGTNVGAVGGPCAHRGLPHPTTVLGVISLNADHFPNGPPPDLTYLAHHEMGHTLGLVGVVQGHQPEWLDVPRQLYRGFLGLHGYFLDAGRTTRELDMSGGHWPFEDVMSRGDRIGRATVGALMDLGYPAAWYGAGSIHD